MTWVQDMSSGKFEVKLNGIEIVILGDTAILEHELSGVYKNEGKWVIPGASRGRHFHSGHTACRCDDRRYGAALYQS
jgi:hypothetical protein